MDLLGCRACNCEKLTPLFSLGEQALVAFPLPDEDYEPVRSPLNLVMCDRCKQVQLEHAVNPDIIYETYWYRSGTNKTMRRILKEVVEQASERVDLQPDDAVIDIGSNDGTLLSNYPENLFRIGFEPSRNVWLESLDKLEFGKSFNDYFRFKGYTAKVITSCAVFYDLPKPGVFLQQLKKSLHPDGVWVDQQNYLGLMIEELTYDNISHEHLSYYSFAVFRKLLAHHGLKVVHVELNKVNGGSMRNIVRHADYPEEPDDTVSDLLEQEKSLRLNNPETYKHFFEQISEARDMLRGFVEIEVERGRTFYIYGASTRGLVVLQFCGLDNMLIDGAAEKSRQKVGRMVVGVEIPIYDEEYVRAQNPDYMLVLPYMFRDEFIEREKDYLDRGGSLVFPLPKFEIVRHAGVAV